MVLRTKDPSAFDTLILDSDNVTLGSMVQCIHATKVVAHCILLLLRRANKHLLLYSMRYSIYDLSSILSWKHSMTLKHLYIRNHYKASSFRIIRVGIGHEEKCKYNFKYVSFCFTIISPFHIYLSVGIVFVYFNNVLRCLFVINSQPFVNCGVMFVQNAYK